MSVNFVESPNIPNERINYCVIDSRLDELSRKFINILGINTIRIPLNNCVYESISGHPDIFLHHLGGNRIVYANELPTSIVFQFEELGFVMIAGESKLGSKYPYNISYNVLRIGEYAFHNLKYTDPVIKKIYNEEGIKLVHVNQGYSKCITCIVDKNTIITEDIGIKRACEKYNIEVLLIKPDKNIRLFGMDYGFFGGTSGLIDNNTLMITGNIYSHCEGEKIYKFLNEKGINIICLSNENLIDIGSILPLGVFL